MFVSMVPFQLSLLGSFNELLCPEENVSLFSTRSRSIQRVYSSLHRRGKKDKEKKKVMRCSLHEMKRNIVQNSEERQVPGEVM